MNLYNFLKEVTPLKLRVYIKTPFIIIIKVLIIFEAILLTPYFLLNNLKIWNNKLIFPFYHHSFGHTITGIDCIARLFFPEKITLIIISNSNSNKYLIKCFEKSYDIYYFDYVLNFKSFNVPKICESI